MADPTRDRILEAALTLFAERGFTGAATRDIAAAAGVNQGLIAYHFGGKEPLFREVVERGLGELLSALVAEPPLRLEGLLAILAGRAPLLRLLTHALLEPGSRRDWLVGGPLTPLATALRAIVARERTGQPLPSDPVVLLTFGAAAAALALFGSAFESAIGQPLDRDRALHAQCDVVRHSIRADGSAVRGPWAAGRAR